MAWADAHRALGERVIRTSHLGRVAAAAACLALASTALVAGTTMAQAETAPVAGDCINVEGDPWDSTAPFAVVDCAEPHNSDVIKVLDYPADAGAPSTIKDQVWGIFDGQCTRNDVLKWLGAEKVKLPFLIGSWLRLPTDEEWTAGARWVVCGGQAMGKGGVLREYEGTLPELFASTPFIDWAMCAPGTPKSGTWNDTLPCAAKSKYLFIPGIMIKGKPGKNYPKDLQAKANGMCAKEARPFLKKGAKFNGLAGLGTASDMPPGEIYGDCFIPLASWNGKTG